MSQVTLDSTRSLLRFLTCGSVDDGKSTLIGRLLYDAQLIFEDQLRGITIESQRKLGDAAALDLSLLVDGLQAEREQGITIDVAYRFFLRPSVASSLQIPPATNNTPATWLPAPQRQI